MNQSFIRSWVLSGTPLAFCFAAAMLVFNLAGCDRGTVAHDPTPWVKDFPAAQSDAAAGGKPMLINFTADWCPPCQDMKKQTLPDPAVQQVLTEKFVTLKVDLTNPGQAENELSEKFGVQYIPTYILISPDGKVLAQRSGFVPKSEFLPWLESALN